jgi:2-polyprenyl-3-methyl-5-hydroxy-6-metoxy-1,4-benzoquinol methylase
MVDDPTHYYQGVDVAQTYDQIRFTSLAGKSFDALEKRYVRKAFRDLRRGSTIVDVPCGTGRLAEVLLEDGFRVVGIDVSAAMLAQAKQKLARFEDRFKCRAVDVMQPDLPADNRYDAALCARVLMHYPLHDQIVFLRNVANLVQGQIVFTQSWVSTYQTLRHSIKRLLHHQSPVRYPLSRDNMARLLAGAGLHEKRTLRPCRLLTEEVIVVATRL